MRTLFPEINPNQTFHLDVGDSHQIYVEECGNPDGIPVVYVHGGPGGGSSPMHRRFYDPEQYRIIQFDQRGCGKSTPHCADDINALFSNTTQHLLRDMEQIRAHLGITSWVVAGGSWGTTLALLYAIKFPSVVKALILRGVFLARKQDLDWFLSPKQGASQIFPEYYRDFVRGHDIESVDSEDYDATQEILESYHEKLTGDNDFEQLAAAKQFMNWEGRIVSVNYQQSAPAMSKHEAIAMSLLNTHYFTNDGFIYESEIISEIAAISHIPGYIVHGRNDVVCKPEGAFTLAEHWPNGVLEMVPAAGHSSTEPGIIDGLVRASQNIAKFLNEKDQEK
ncbi:prolyl aminopeptidase [Psychrosphaera ytuae]|uniref:Proline iminopeptidase n=1 Tax=Psychrosphaera ytuae TaxID=2820710 RepID=A0A975DA12_9GAMM|nr:prolyl aminopeptidase [Psychrosphaera ytuae]QTH63365.1 prolyl aminopeptidase [Psychrosphaera ytuae]